MPKEDIQQVGIQCIWY